MVPGMARFRVPAFQSEDMKAYCINLDRRPDRLEYITAEFARVGVPFERVSAVDGQDPVVAAAAARLSATAAGAPMSTGAYACFQSHRDIWRRLVASGAPHAMAFEDDLLLSPGLAPFLQDGWVPPDADLVKMETFGTRIHVAAGPGLAVKDRHLHRLRSYHRGTGCFVISAKAAARLLAATDTFSEAIDTYLFSETSPAFADLVTYQMVPAPVIQGDRAGASRSQAWSKSSIEARFAPGAAARRMQKESRLGRLQRRLTEELRGRLNGTRYVFVPHG
jgi:glycosyl transferase, family 25